MVTETETREFDRYVARTMPDWLSEPPSIVPAEVTQDAREHHRQRAAYEYMQSLARGWTVAELATGQLERGAEVQLLTGRVVRRRSEVDPAIMERAAVLVHELGRRALSSDPHAMLLKASNGVLSAHPNTLLATMSAAEGEIRAYDARQEAARAAEARKVTVRFFRPAEGFEVGEHGVDGDVVTRLEAWWQGMEAKRAAGETLPVAYRDGSRPFEVLKVAPTDL